MERCEILLKVIKDFDERGEPLWPTKLVTHPDVTKAMSYVVAHRHLKVLADRGDIILSVVTHRIDKRTNTEVERVQRPLMTAKKELTHNEYGLHAIAKVRTWDINKKLIFIEELATMNIDEKTELFEVLHSIDDSLAILAGKKNDNKTEAEKIAHREVKV